jgi:type I restriction enzyme M protein
MRRSNCAGALQYIPELTWILFLRILDERETQEADEAAAVGAQYQPSLEAPFRWRDWAAPDGPKRLMLQTGALGAFFGFVNGELLPYLRGLRDRPGATARQKVISEIMSGVERVRIDTERNMLDVLDKVQEISAAGVDPTHVFALSQVYESLLLKMGEKNNDGGQFFTPREIIRALVRVVDPKPGDTVYDPGCGTGGFLAQSMEYMLSQLGDDATAEQIEALKQRTFYGREKENLIYPIALANLVLHGIDQPHVWQWQYADRCRDLWGIVPGCACSVRRSADESTVRWKGRFCRSNEIRIQEQFDTGAFSAARYRQPEARWKVWHSARRGFAVSLERKRPSSD